MWTVRTMLQVGMVLLAVGVLLAGVLYGTGVGGALVTVLLWMLVTSILGGFLLLAAAAVRSASTRTMIVVGAVLQLLGAGFLLAGPPVMARSLPFLTVMVLSTIGVWLTLTGVIGVGVQLGIREHDGSGRSTGPES